MKKFAKVTAIIALICAVLGVVLAGIGTIGGGAKIVGKMAEDGLLSVGPEDGNWFERISNFQISVSTDGETKFNTDYEIFTAGNHEFSATAEEVDSFVFNLTLGEVNMKKGSGEEWKVEIDGVGSFQTYVENGTLYVVGNQSGIGGGAGDVTIIVPAEEKLASAELDLGAGDMLIDYLAADVMEISAGAANVEIEEVYAQDLKLSVGAGNIEVEDGSIGNLEAGVGMGNMEIAGTITGNIEGEVAMGELVITVYGSEKEDHNYDVACAAGEVKVGNNSYAGVGNDQEIDNGADTTYTLDCALGLIEVRFK